MELVYECTYRAELDPRRLMVGPGPFGTRVVSTVTGGWCKGDRLSGTLSGAGGDWFLGGKDETQFDDQYFRTLIRMESGAPAYAWVNTTAFVGRGRVVPGGVEYEVFRVT
jgi:hypothetical protein